MFPETNSKETSGLTFGFTGLLQTRSINFVAQYFVGLFIIIIIIIIIFRFLYLRK